ncbi:protein kinase [Streptomyces sp. NPDC057245]|uniref:protein kinase n=1 Tax=Streptomyces sp. NPDC057245 TaxID=3346065 RepID=UPI003645A0A0
MDDYAGRVLADRYRLPLPPSDEYELTETRAFDTYSGQEVLVRQVPLPEVVEAEVLDAEGLPDGFTARDGGLRHPGVRHSGRRSPAAGGAVRRPADPVVRRAVEAAQAAAAVPDHPRLDQVFDVFAEGGSLWIVSELVAARPLAALLAEQTLTPYRAAEVASDVLLALRVLHTHGWVHRNITARTVLVCDDGRVMLTGLAAGAAEEALCGYDPVPVPDEEPPPATGPGGTFGPGGGTPGASGTTAIRPGSGSVAGAGVGTGAGSSGPGGARAGILGPASGPGPGDADPEAARRAAIEARGVGELPVPGTPTPGPPGLAPAPLDPAGEARAARAGAIAAYRAGARAAARVQEAQNGRAALPGARPAPDSGADGLPQRTTAADGHPGHGIEGGAGDGAGAGDGSGGARPGRGPDAGRDAYGVDAGRDAYGVGPGFETGPVDYGARPGSRPYAGGGDVPAGDAGFAAGPGSAGDRAFETGSGAGPGPGPGSGSGSGGVGGAAFETGARPVGGGGFEGGSSPGGGAGFGSLPGAAGAGPGANAPPGQIADPYGVGTGDPWHGTTPRATGPARPVPTAPAREAASLEPGLKPSLEPGLEPGVKPGVEPGVESGAAGAGGWDGPSARTPASRGPATALDAERARQTRMAVVGPVTERWAPEQAGPVHENWQLAAPIGPATDLWALGALLFRAVQGHAPYPEESTAELVQIVCAEPPAFAEECGPLRPVVESLLRQDPTERIDFEELRGWLRSLVRSAPEPEAGLNVIPAPPAETSRLPIVRRRGELVRRRRAGLPAHHGRHKRGREPARSPRSLGRTLLLVILLALAGAVAYAVFFMPKSGTADSGTARTGAAGGASRAPAESSPDTGSEPEPERNSPTTDPGASGTAGGSTEPQSDVADGFTLRKDQEGFSVAVAEGWDRTPRNGSGQVVYGKGDFELLVVPGRDRASEFGDDPMAYQRDSEPELASYRASSWATSSGLKTIEVGGRTSAEGQFTWTGAKGELFVHNAAVLIDGRYHVVQVRGPEAERDEVSRIFEQASATYRYAP